MSCIANKNTKSFFDRFQDFLSQQLGPAKGEQLARFAQQFFVSSHADFEEFFNREINDVYATMLAVWQFIQQRQGQSIKLAIVEPTIPAKNWQAQHTLIEVIQPDRPFVVDSIRNALSRHGLNVQMIFNAVLQIERDAQGNLIDFNLSETDPQAQESIVYLEIDHLLDTKLQTEFEQELLGLLDDVRCVTDDYAAMRAEVEKAICELTSLNTSVIQPSHNQETIAFLQWLLNDHFTFLGTACFQLDLVNSAQLSVHADSQHGLLRQNSRLMAATSPYLVGQTQADYELIPQLLRFAKSTKIADIHRNVYPDYIYVQRFDAKGEIIGAYCFYGLYTLTVYSDSPRNIPILRQKIAQMMTMARINSRSHHGRNLQRILETYPRDELFHSSVAELCHIALGIMNMRERRQVRLFIRTDLVSGFYSCLIYLPRDTYTTALQSRIEQYLSSHLQAVCVSATPALSESVVMRLHLILKFDQAKSVDIHSLEKHIAHLTWGWHERLKVALMEQWGEKQGYQLNQQYSAAFPLTYQVKFNTLTATEDIQAFEKLLQSDQPIYFCLVAVDSHSSSLWQLKVYLTDEPPALSAIVPILENCGFEVQSEELYLLNQGYRTLWLDEFNLRLLSSNESLPAKQWHSLLLEALSAIWQKKAENDCFNHLVTLAACNWQQVVLWRAYGRYLRQIRFGFSQQFLAATLARYPQITALLWRKFANRFALDNVFSVEEDAALTTQFTHALSQVETLNEDQVLRRYLELIEATLRTNYFQLDAKGMAKDYLALKIAPRQIHNMPEPRPLFEIFVYSARMEGLHLRGGYIARGGLRWSDRYEDYRTEILGLMKAQQVKNAVIVPTGAKGGFVCKKLPTHANPQVIQQEAIECYRILIHGLLDLTDNIIDKQIVPPCQVVRYDEDDPYLVVAADKGTATFSDIANEIAKNYQFWLGDAFASGGSHGYDHKKIGITARGAWESVKRHFRELGKDIQNQSITVLAIGDMSGDVFGNAMLQSRYLQLVAAFNHRHIFIDPNPDCDKSFNERKRLFDEQLGWDGYQTDLISTGGGVFERSAKSILISPAMQERFQIDQTSLAPDELIKVLLKSDVELFFNGGIGTYVKATTESDAEVGDKSNDLLRINGAELNCAVIGEGGNLGLTQAGRCEAAQRGIKLYTDFIDNAGGVNCSDHEVNIKILLDVLIQTNQLTVTERNNFLVSMTEEVAQLVLRDNYTQAQGLALCNQDSQVSIGSYRRLINALEKTVHLNRQLATLPNDLVMHQRQADQQGMLTPELATLMAYAKMECKMLLQNSVLLDEDIVLPYLYQAFPQSMVEHFKNMLPMHKLKHEIIATQLSNEIIDHLGITFMRRLLDGMQQSAEMIIRAYLIIRSSFDLVSLWQQIEKLDGLIASQLQYQLLLDLQKLTFRQTRYFLCHHNIFSMVRTASVFHDGLVDLLVHHADYLDKDEQSAWQTQLNTLVAQQVPTELANHLTALQFLPNALSAIAIAENSQQSLTFVAKLFFAVGKLLELPWVLQLLEQLKTQDSWEILAREALRDDIERQHILLVSELLQLMKQDDTLSTVNDCLELLDQRSKRWQHLLEHLHEEAQPAFACFALVQQELALLVNEWVR